MSAKDAEGKYEYTYTPCDLAVCGDSGEAASVVSPHMTHIRHSYSENLSHLLFVCVLCFSCVK